MTLPRLSCAAIALACTAAHAQTQQPIGQSGIITQAALNDQAALCPTGEGYPAAWAWPGPTHSLKPATAGTPLIQQFRAGALIATYSSFADGAGCNYQGGGLDWQDPGPAAASGCGPFTREHTYRLFAPGDDFKVYAAVYSGENQQPYIGPTYTGDRPYPNGEVSPDHVTIEGVEIGGRLPVIYLNAPASNNTLGQAPVYFDRSTGVTWRGIIVQAGPAWGAGKAGIYNSAASNLTMDRIRVTGFQGSSATPDGQNGIFGAANYHGFWRILNSEIDHNGGNNGSLTHNVYIAASITDPNYTVTARHIYSHDVFEGHLFKCRCQNLEFNDNYLDGGLPLPGNSDAEVYDLDFPNGGQLTARGNVFVKNQSGPDANGISLAYAAEGLVDSRPLSIDIENNTFVALAKTYDGSHPLSPMGFFYPQLVPGTQGFPVANTTVRDNAFVGYCPTGNPALDYRGDFAGVEGFAEIGTNYGFSATFIPDDADYSVVGLSIFAPVAHSGGVRKLPTIGAFD
jgi:hypothetical protein